VPWAELGGSVPRVGVYLAGMEVFQLHHERLALLDGEQPFWQKHCWARSIAYFVSAGAARKLAAATLLFGTSPSASR